MTLYARHLAVALLLVAGPALLAQQQPSEGQTAHGRDNRPHNDPHAADDYHIMPEGMPSILWWRIPGLAQKIGLTAEQLKRMDDILSQNRGQLFQLSHDLHKQRDLLQPMLDANPPETAKILPQLDRVAQARATLEVARDKVLLNIRTVLTPDQWNKLQAENRRWQAEHPNDQNSQPSGDRRGRNHTFQGRPGSSQPAPTAQPPA